MSGSACGVPTAFAAPRKLKLKLSALLNKCAEPDRARCHPRWPLVTMLRVQGNLCRAPRLCTASTSPTSRPPAMWCPTLRHSRARAPGVPLNPACCLAHLPKATAAMVLHWLCRSRCWVSTWLMPRQQQLVSCCAALLSSCFALVPQGLLAGSGPTGTCMATGSTRTASWPMCAAALLARRATTRSPAAAPPAATHMPPPTPSPLCPPSLQGTYAQPPPTVPHPAPPSTASMPRMLTPLPLWTLQASWSMCPGPACLIPEPGSAPRPLPTPSHR